MIQETAAVPKQHPMPTYPWKRFWAPREGVIHLSDGGYLSDPDDKHGKLLNPQLVALSALHDLPCLVLLGEPGIGKSTVFADNHAETKERSRDAPHRFVYQDLRSFGSEDRLVRTIFEGSEVQSWKSDDTLLYLYLDSLDECSVRVTNLAALLVEQLRHVPRERLRLRLACRTAEWPRLLENDLKGWHDANSIKILELAPLRRADVQLAATLNGVSAEAFVGQVYTSGAIPLAIKPITLEFLLKLYATKGALPSTQVELYERGCALLCEESNESRQAAGYTGRLSAGDRLNVASWIAAAMTFCGKNVIRLPPTTEPQAPDEIDLAELTPSKESPTEAHIQDTLKVSGLFTSRGASRLGWAHKTYAEFLAARFVANRKLPSAQVADLIFHHQDRDAVIPQLREAASWIASMREDMLLEIAEREPQVLLASDVMKADATTLATLVRHLLERFDRLEALDDHDWDKHPEYWKLKHPTLAAQLKPYIPAKDKNVIVRRVAIDIAEACELHDLEEDLVAVALDATDEKQARQQAAAAILHIGGSASRARLRPLLACDKTEDPQDQLRGLALRALYPEHMSLHEMFSLLSPPRDDNLYGSYKGFMYERATTLKPAELPDALVWALNTPFGHQYSGAVNKLGEAILRLAWAHAADATVTPGLVALVEQRLKAHERCFGEDEAGKVSRPEAPARRLVAHALLSKFDRDHVTSLLYGEDGILDLSDLPWLLDTFEASHATANGATRLIARLAWSETNADVLSRAIGVAETHAELGEEMAGMLRPVLIDSTEAQHLREQHEVLSGRRQRRPKSVVANLPKRVNALLHKCETEDIHTWWALSCELSLGANSTHYGDNFDFRITNFSGWHEASNDTKARTVQLAKRYIVEGDAKNSLWLGTDGFQLAALAGYRALQLVHELDPDWLTRLDTASLEQWVPIIMCYPPDSSVELVALAMAKAPTRALSASLAHIDSQAGAERVDAHRPLDSCWTEAIASALLQKASSTSAQTVQNELIKQGIAHGDSRFIDLGQRIATEERASGDASKARTNRINLWRILIETALAAVWSKLWEMMQSDRALARDVWFETASHYYRDTTVLTPLTPDQVADLYLWFVQEFPPETVRRRNGWVGPTESIATFRDRILTHLTQRGDWQSLPAIDRIVAALPHDDLMKIHKVLARRAASARTWLPPRVTDVARMLRDSDARIVESAEQLMSVVLESLRRFQKSLHDELPAVVDLWNNTESGWRPVDEGDLSNRITRHLRQDLRERGIVASREVKIRWRRPGFDGEQTDIYVDALSLGTAGTRPTNVSLIIEVKGCWNSEVKTAMRTQLFDRYLADNSCTHGLYLVGWFTDEGWDDRDARKQDAARLLPGGADDTRRLLEDQARSLTRDGKVIAAFVLDARLGSASRPS